MTTDASSCSPGSLKEVISVGTSRDKNYVAFHLDFHGFKHFNAFGLKTALSRSESIAGGSGITFEEIEYDSNVASDFLSARRMLDVAKKVDHLHTKFSVQVQNPKFTVPEPMAKAYSNYGEFENRTDVKWTPRDFKGKAIQHVMVTCQGSYESRKFSPSIPPANARKQAFNKLYTDQLTWTDSGDIQVALDRNLSVKIELVAKGVMAHQGEIPFPLRMSLIKELDNACNETQYWAVIDMIIRNTVITRAEIQNFAPRLQALPNGMRQAINSWIETNTGEDAFVDGFILSARSIRSCLGRIGLVFERIRNSLTISGLNFVTLPKYEGGHVCQLAGVLDECVWLSQHC